MNSVSYLLIRLGIGISFFGHGLVRLPKLQAFSEGMMKNFEKSMLPPLLVQPFSYILPFAEFVIGLMLIIGLFTRNVAIAGGVVMLMLMFGTATLENWDAFPSQMIHLAFMACVVQFVSSNKWAIDRWSKK